jgi:alpha-tubulin suppressor-like RCC1 family protein
LRASGAVSCWGNNDDGQLGNGTTDSSLIPIEIPELGNVTSLVAGAFHTCAIRPEGVYCWGQNDHGQLGIGSMTGANSPRLVTGI